MNSKKWMGTGLALAMVATVTVGCGDNTKDQASGSDTAKPQVFNIAYTAEPPTLDPSTTTANAAFTIMNAITEGLYRIDKDNKVQPAMASALPEISKDGKTYTVKLRDGVTWADGSPVTAHDFEYSWKRTADPASKSQYAFMMNQWIEGAADFNSGKEKTGDKMGVIAKDDKTLEIHLIQPVAFFTSQLAFPLFLPENKAFVEKNAGKYGADADKTLANGPFILDKWEHEQSLVLKKNPKYWDAANVKLESVTLQIVKDTASAVNLFQADQVDLAQINRDQVTEWKDKPEYTLNPELTNAYFQFNGKVKGLDNAKIRKALTLAVDRQAYVDVVLGNGSVPSTGLVPVGTADGNGGIFRKTAGDNEAAFNADEAKKLLAEGLKEAGLEKLPTFKFLGDDTETARKTLEFIQAQWKQNLGVDIDPNPVPHKVRLDKSKNHDYDIVMSLWGADYNDPMTFLDMWITGGDFNEVNYSNTAYDEKVKKAQTEVDPKVRTQLMVDAEKILMNDMPVGPLYFRTMAYIKRTSVQGLFFPVAGAEWELKWASIK
jgi:oligopeptide transport system substrate-binding protein